MTAPGLQKGDKVVHASQPELHGVGTIVGVHGEDEEREYEVAWPMPGSVALARWEPAAVLHVAPPG